MDLIAIGSGGGGASPSDLNVKFNPIPIAEADADAETYVNQFLGGYAANEPGAGGGMNGADLVWTQSGSVPASDGEGRIISAAGHYFTPTLAFMNRFNMRDNVTIIYKCSHFTVSGHLCYVLASGASAGFGWLLYPMTTNQVYASGPNGGTGANVAGAWSEDWLPINDVFWHVMSINAADKLAFSGIAIKDTLPDKITDFSCHSFVDNAVRSYSTVDHFYVGNSTTFKHIVGTLAYGNATFKIHSVSVSEKPFISLA